MTHAVVLSHENHLSLRREEVCHDFVTLPAEERVSVSRFDGGVVSQNGSGKEYVGGVVVYQLGRSMLSDEVFR